MWAVTSRNESRPCQDFGQEHGKDSWRGIFEGEFGFPSSSAGKESTCNAGDPGSISGLGRSSGEGISYSLQYSWASLMAQTLKNLPAMWETWVSSLCWDDPLKKGTENHSNILAWRLPWTQATIHGIAKSQTWLSNFHFHDRSTANIILNGK